MADTLTRIDDLFNTGQIPVDESGCLRSVIQVMPGLNASLLMLTDAGGRLIGVENVDFPADPEAIRRTATQIAKDLTGKRFCTIECAPDSRQYIRFGVRLTGETNGGVLGGLLDNSDTASEELERLCPALVAFGSVIWFGIHASRNRKEQARRVMHLLAEQATLKHAHAHTVTTVIDEREERIRQQRDYVIHLEREVEKRTDELREAMGKANEANEAKSLFLANMSHEIRTPLTAILGFTENMLDADQSESERLNCIHTIRRNGEYLLSLISDILDLSKIEAGKIAIEGRDCQPCRIVAEVASLMRVRAGAKGLPFNIEYIGAIPETIQSDPTRLRQILINLIGNAIKFTEVGAVRLVTRFVDDGVEPRLQFDVIDTGRGMTAEQVAKLFQPFMQADSSTTRTFGGTGLGLTISKRFAELLGGNVTVAATEMGVGTTFRTTVASGSLDSVKMLEDPVSATVVADIAGTVSQVSPTDLRGLRILFAEDGPDNQRLISFVLKKAGADVTVKENGKLALDAALAARSEGNPFDVILMDMQMPVMDGYEATGQLRQKGYTGPIIALTAHAMDGDREKCIKAGCDDYATKPIDRKKLIATIQKHVCSVTGQVKTDHRRAG